MRAIEPLSLAAAGRLLDFSGQRRAPEQGAGVPQAALAPISSGIARQQLEGAVAIHNILAREGFAYLADEVGMGKTYVALGVVALLQHFHPGFRVLYIVPSAPLQRKWLDDRANFVARNFLVEDLRVRAFDGMPAQPIRACENLAHWGELLSVDAQRDFLLRMSSFSLSISEGGEDWEGRRAQLRRVTHHLDPDVADLRHKRRERFRDGIGRTLNQLLPRYDLVIVDEAHNLKHGRRSDTTRNRLLDLILGGHPEAAGEGLPVERRLSRLLLLSATPVETDYAQLWNQLDLFGFGSRVPELDDAHRPEAEKRERAARFLVRRVTSLDVAGEELTKNMYRREWRGGGVERHDDPLELPDTRQRLIVALVQKKVAELLREPRFGASFQMGMLASFESFLETTRLAPSEEDEAEFDDAREVESEIERDGVDSTTVGELAADYRKRFGNKPMPHPKMDGVVRSLASCFETGEKTLVFVRRIKSVPELAEKLSREYDTTLFRYLESRLPEPLWRELQPQVERYRRQLRRQQDFLASSVRVGNLAGAPEEPESGLPVDESPVALDDRGGRDTFFAWFFRGERDLGILSGAALRKNRLMAEGSVYSTLFEDNPVAALLGFPAEPAVALAEALGRPWQEVRAALQARAVGFLTEAQRRRKPRRPVYLAIQRAALEALADSKSSLKEAAEIVLQSRFGRLPPGPVWPVPEDFSDPDEFLGVETFFTRLRRHPGLCARLWPPGASARAGESLSSTAFREQESRRLLLEAAATLGHAFIDLWLEAVTDLESLELGGRETPEATTRLIDRLLSRLENQRIEAAEAPRFDAFAELSAIAEHHDLIHAVSFADARNLDLVRLGQEYARALRAQTPVGGMYGEVNATLKRQFCLPGYPLVLVTTDVLQEGVDLHTFCSRVMHYGISWTPSSMEQRTGRVDRIQCLAHRRLARLDRPPAPDDLLQVFFPYLRDTVERVQARRIFVRMNRFLELLHTGLETESGGRRIPLDREMIDGLLEIPPVREKLQSAFPVRPEHLDGAPSVGPSVGEERSTALRRHFRDVQKGLERTYRVEWDRKGSPTAVCGTVFRSAGRLLPPGNASGTARQQPFVLFLGFDAQSGAALLRAISPVGKVPYASAAATELLLVEPELEGVKICELPGDEADTYSLTAEGDILFDAETTQQEEVDDLLERVCLGADRLEATLLELLDQPLATFRRDLGKEHGRGLA